jgi:carbonic anhydrase/acetyltransferase-like protein (isoleucine patch superfamily)
VKKTFLRRAFNRVLHLAGRVSPGAKTLRPFFHRLRGVKIGKNVFIGDDVYLENEYPELVELHDNTILSTRCMIIAHTRGGGRITIGPDVLIGSGAMIVCPVGKALKIGAGSVISTGSVISSSVGPEVLVTPPRSVAVAKVTVPWTQIGSFEQFVAGIRPLPRKEKKIEGTGPPFDPSFKS